jgi:hypothetical protein
MMVVDQSRHENDLHRARSKGPLPPRTSWRDQEYTGVDQAYEVPEHPELRLMTTEHDAAMLAEQVIDELVRRGIF